tara:strand:+ start:3546 stop:8603 length:5058 start_codon:yes stop_codon:yes gene_type:complete
VTDLSNEAKESALNFAQTISGSGVNPSGTFRADPPVREDLSKMRKGYREAYGVTPVDVERQRQEEELKGLDAVESRNQVNRNKTTPDFSQPMVFNVLGLPVSSDVDLRRATTQYIGRNRDPDIRTLSLTPDIEGNIFVSPDGEKSLVSFNFPRDMMGNIANTDGTVYSLAQFQKDAIVPLANRIAGVDIATVLNELKGPRVERDKIETLLLQLTYDALESDRRLLSLFREKDPEGVKFFEDKLVEKIDSSDKDRFPIVASTDMYGKDYLLGQTYDRHRRSLTPEEEDQGPLDFSFPRSVGVLGTEQTLEPFNDFALENIRRYNENRTFWNTNVPFTAARLITKTTELLTGIGSEDRRSETVARTLEDFFEPIFDVTPRKMMQLSNMAVGAGGSIFGYKRFSEEDLNNPDITHKEVLDAGPQTLQDELLYFLAKNFIGESIELGADTDIELMEARGEPASKVLKPGAAAFVDPTTDTVAFAGKTFSVAELPVDFALFGLGTVAVQVLRKTLGVGLSKALKVPARGGGTRENLTGFEISRDARKTRKELKYLPDGDSKYSFNKRVDVNVGTRVLDALLTNAHQMTPMDYARLQLGMHTGFGAGVGVQKLLPDEYKEDHPAATFFATLAANIVGGFMIPAATGSMAQAGFDLTGLSTLGTKTANVVQKAGYVGRFIFGDDRTMPEALGRASRREGVSGPQGRAYVTKLTALLDAVKFNEPDTWETMVKGREEIQEFIETVREPIILAFGKDSDGNPSVYAQEILNTLQQGLGEVTLLDAFRAARLGNEGLLVLKRNNLLSQKELAQSVLAERQKADAVMSEKNLQVALFRTLGAIEQQWEVVKNKDENVGGNLRKVMTQMYEVAAEPFGGTDKDGSNVLVDNFITAFSIVNEVNKGVRTKEDASNTISVLYGRLDDKQKDTFASYIMGHPDGYGDISLQRMWEDSIPQIREIAIEQRNRVKKFKEKTFDNSRLNDKDESKTPRTSPVSEGNAPSANYTLLSKIYTVLNNRVNAQYAIAFGDNTKAVVPVKEIMAEVEAVGDEAKAFGFSGDKAARIVEAAGRKIKKEYANERKLEGLDPEDDAPKYLVDDLGNIDGNSLGFSLRELNAIASDLSKQAISKQKSGNNSEAAVFFQLSAVYRKHLDEYAETNAVFDTEFREAVNLYKEIIANPFRNTGLRKKILDESIENIILEVFKGPNARANYNALILELRKEKDAQGKVFPDFNETKKLAESLTKQLKKALDDDFYSGQNLVMSSTEKFNRLRKIVASSTTTPASSGTRGYRLYRPSREGGFLDLLLGSKGMANQLKRENKLYAILNDKDQMLFEDSQQIIMKNFDHDQESEMLTDLVVHDSASRKSLENVLNTAVSALIRLNMEDLKASEMSDVWITLGQKNSSEAAETLVDEIVEVSKQNSENPPRLAIDKFNQIVKDAEKFLGKEEAQYFEGNLKKYIAFRLYDRLKEKRSNDIEVIKQDLTDIQNDFAKMKPFYVKIYGEDEAKSMETFLQLKNLQNQGLELTIKTAGDLSPMSPTMALSRAWGYARGVVGIRYILSEFLLRRFASRKRGNLDAVISDPEFANAYMDMMMRRKPVDPKRRSYIKTRIVAALLQDANEEETEKVLNGIGQLYENAVGEGIDPTLALMSLMMASYNKPFMETLDKEYKKEGFPEGVRGQIQMLQNPKFLEKGLQQ